ncbi:unnamed protein product [Aphanomyces euteiches]
MSLKTPVPDDFFNPPPLSATKVDELRAIGHRARRDLLEYTKMKGGPIEWTLHTNDGKVQVYTAREENLPLFLGTTLIESTLDEVRAIFTAPTTADIRRINSAYYPDILDEHLEDVSIDGKKAWIRAFKSVELIACPELERRYGIIRAEFLHSGYIFMETDKIGTLRVIELQHVAPNGHVHGDLIGAMLVTLAVESQYNSMNSMQNNVYAHRLCQLSYLPSTVVGSKQPRTKCSVCLKKFGTFTRKSNCRRCGDVVCSKVCSAKYKLLIANLRVELRVCSRCIPGPNEVGQAIPLSTPMKRPPPRDDLSAYSEMSNPSYVYPSKQTHSFVSASTHLTPSANSSINDMFAHPGRKSSKMFMTHYEDDGPIEHDLRGSRPANHFEPSNRSTPRRRGDMVLLS